MKVKVLVWGEIWDELHGIYFPIVKFVGLDNDLVSEEREFLRLRTLCLKGVAPMRILPSPKIPNIPSLRHLYLFNSRPFELPHGCTYENKDLESYRYVGKSYNLGSLDDVFKAFPRLKHLSLGFVDDRTSRTGHEGSFYKPFSDQELSLESISLTEAFAPFDNIAKLIRSCGALKAFRYRLTMTPDPSTGPIIYDALRSQISTLEHIQIDQKGSMEFLHPVPFLRSLSGFSALKRLAVNASCLMGHTREIEGEDSNPPAPFRLSELLPRSLKTLILTDRLGHVFGDSKILLHLAEDCAASLPNLEQVIMYPCVPPGHENLESEIRKSGVQLLSVFDILIKEEGRYWEGHREAV